MKIRTKCIAGLLVLLILIQSISDINLGLLQVQDVYADTVSKSGPINMRANPYAIPTEIIDPPTPVTKNDLNSRGDIVTPAAFQLDVSTEITDKKSDNILQTDNLFALMTTSALSIPTNFVVVTTENSLLATWDSVAEAESYDISLDSEIINVRTPECIFDDLEPNTSHAVKVRAVNQAGNGEWSEELEKQTLLSAPENLAATSSGISVDLKWEAVADATGYEIYRNADKIGTVITNTYYDSRLTAETTYVYKIRAYNDANISSYSNECTIKAIDSANVPTETAAGSEKLSEPLDFRISAKTDTSIALEWNQAADYDGKDYEIYLGEKLLASVTGTTYSALNLTPNTMYTFTVRGKDTEGNVSESAAITAATNAKISAFSFLISGKQITGNIDQAARTISLSVPENTDVSEMAASFNSSAASVTVGEIEQASGITPNDFTKPVIYTAISIDGSSVDYVVTVLENKVKRNFIQVAAYDYYTVALKEDGTVWKWGYSEYDGPAPDSGTPVQVEGISGVKAFDVGCEQYYPLMVLTEEDAVAGAKAIAAGYFHYVELKEDGTVWTCGNNEYGQLGSDSVYQTDMPIKVEGINRVVAVAAGNYLSLALKEDGTVWQWGEQRYLWSPVQVEGLSDVKMIFAGWDDAFAIKKDGTLWQWDYRSTPVQIEGISEVNMVAVGYNHIVAVKEDGTVWAWGGNDKGQLGNGTTEYSDIPVQVEGIRGVRAVAAGQEYTVAIKEDGTVWAWGSNLSGQLCNDSIAASTIPVEILYEKVATPVIHPQEGVYDSTQTVTLSCATEGADIRYTIDGSTPALDSAVYNGPFTIEATTTIKAYAVKGEMFHSNLASADCFIGADNIPPTTPTELSVPDIKARTLTLTWTASTDNLKITAYDIYIDGIKAASSTAAYCILTDLLPGTTHSLSVKAVDIADNISEESDTVTVTTLNDDYGDNMETAENIQIGVEIPVNSDFWDDVDYFKITPSIDDKYSISTVTGDNSWVYPYGMLYDSNGRLLISGYIDNTRIIYSLKSNSTYYLCVKSDWSTGNYVLLIANIDKIAPTAPANFQLTSQTDGYVSFSWSASTDNMGVSGYELYRNGILVNTVSGEANECSDTGLKPLTTHTYTLKAFDIDGNRSLGSEEISITVGEDTQAPTTPDYLSYYSLTAWQVNLYWGTSFDNFDVAKYEIYNGTTLIGTTTQTNYILGGLTPDRQYSIAVRAVDKANNRSAESNVIIFNTLVDDYGDGIKSAGLISLNTDISGVIDTYYDEDFLKFTPEVDGTYRISSYDEPPYTVGCLYNSNGKFIISKNIYEIPITYNLTANNTYYLQVSGLGHNYIGEYRIKISLFDGGQEPLAPTDFKATAVIDGTVALSWSPSTDEAIKRYNLYRNGSLIQVFNGSTYEGSDRGLSPLTAYSYTLKALYADGNSSPDSQSVIITTGNDTQAPSPPAGLSASAITDSKVTLTWEASTDNFYVARYDVYSGSTLLATSTATNCTLTGLASGTEYAFAVKAVDASDNVSAASDEVSVRTKDDYGNDINSAVEIAIEADITAEINFAGDDDYFYFTPKIDGLYSINGYPDIPYLRGDLYYSNGNLIAYENICNKPINYNLEANQTYYLRVSSGSYIGQYKIKVTLLDTKAPSAPANLTVSGLTASKVTLAWLAATDDIKVARYDIFNGSALIAASAVSNCTLTGLIPGTEYKFSVQAVDTSNNVSAFSNEITVTTKVDDCGDDIETATPVDIGIEVAAVINYTGDIDYFSFTPSVNGRYKINSYNKAPYQSGHLYDNNEKLIASGEIYKTPIVYDLEANQTYYLKVSSQNYIGQYKFKVEIMDTEAPSIPEHLITSEVADGKVTLSWSPSTDNVGVTGYDIYEGGNLLSSVTGTTYTAINLKSNKSYLFTIQARDEEGNVSEFGNFSEVKTADADIFTFNLEGFEPVVTGSIDKTKNIITLFVPEKTLVNSLVASFSTIGSACIKVGTVEQVSGITSNDFSNPIVYTVTATDGSISSYTVIVKEPLGKPENLKALTRTNNLITLEWDAASNNQRVKSYDIYAGERFLLSVTDTCYVARDLFPNTLYTFSVRAKDAEGNTSPDSIIQSSTKAGIKSFTFSSIGSTVYTKIYEPTKTIVIEVPDETDVSSLAANFSAEAATVKVGTNVQVSGTTINDFTHQVIYTVVCDDGSTVDYTVIVTKNAEGPGFVKISVDYSGIVALKQDGTVWKWERDNILYEGQTSPERIGLSRVKEISCFNEHSVALKEDGTVWTWGKNKYGEFGDGNKDTSSRKPVLALINGVKSIAAGAGFTIALKEDGTLWAWGWSYGSIPVQIQGLSGIKTIAAGQNYTFVKDDGTVWSTYIQGNHIAQQIKISEVKEIECGVYFEEALKEDGTVWVWNNDISYSNYVDNVIEPKIVSGISDVKAIATRDYKILALKTDGTVWRCWDSWGESKCQFPVYGIVKQMGESAYGFDTYLMEDGTIWLYMAGSFFRTTYPEDSNLKSININNEPILDFDEHVTDYTVILSSEFGEIPAVSAVTYNPQATYTVTRLEPNTAIITVKAQDGVTRKSYTIHFVKLMSNASITRISTTPEAPSSGDMVTIKVRIKNSDSEAAAINNISYLVDGKEIYSDASLYIVEAGAELEASTSNGTSVLTALGNHVVSVAVNGNINNTGSLIVEGKGGPDEGGGNTYIDLKDYFKQNVFNVVGSGYTYIDFNGDLAKAFEVWLKAKYEDMDYTQGKISPYAYFIDFVYKRTFFNLYNFWIEDNYGLTVEETGNTGGNTPTEQAEEIWLYLEMIQDYQAIVEASAASLLSEECPTLEAINEYKLNLRHVIQYLQMKLLDNPLIMSNSTVSRFLAQNILDGKGINLIDDTLVRASLRDSSSVIDQVFGEYVHKVWMECTSMLLNFVPVVGSLKAIAEGIVGHDLLTGRQYAWWERAFNIGMGSIALVGEVGLLAVTLKEARLAGKLSEVATIAGNSAVKAMAEAISKIKAGASDMLEGIKNIIRGEGYYEFATPDGMIFRMADEEIPVVSRSILDKIADAIRNAINKAKAIGITDEAELTRIGENVEQAMKNGSKFTEPTLAEGGTPRGNYEVPDVNDSRPKELQNQASDLLADKGYDLEMLPEKIGGNGHGVTDTSNPDYLIDGIPFDCYSPKADTPVRNIWSTVKGKTETQARRIVLNMDDFAGSMNDLAKQFNDWSIDTLDELLILKDGKISRLIIK